MRLLLAFGMLMACWTASARADTTSLIRFPQATDPACNHGHSQIYDECNSQAPIYARALAEARKSGKVLLVSFGAEWCIWCHVFEAHLVGEAGSFHYAYDNHDVTLNEHAAPGAPAEAETLRAFAAKNFVLVNIEAEKALDGMAVVLGAGVAGSDVQGLPFIFSVTADGKVAAVFNQDAAEVRRDTEVDWYRGYNRKALLAELQRLHDAAMPRAVK